VGGFALLIRRRYKKVGVVRKIDPESQWRGKCRIVDRSIVKILRKGTISERSVKR